MCTSLDGSSIQTAKGRRDSDGTFTPTSQLPLQVGNAPRLNATDVPMGTGALDAARLAILERRERLRRAGDED